MRMLHSAVVVVLVVFIVALAVAGAWVAGVGPFQKPPQALRVFINPSIDTTAGLPGSPYTTCTSLSLLGVSGQTGPGVVWTTANAAYNPQTKQFLAKETIDTTKASGAAGFISSTCFQMSFTFEYVQVPWVGDQQVPFALRVVNISYTVMGYNNGSKVDLPVFAKVPSGVNGMWDWGVLVQNDNAIWTPACQEFSQKETLGTGGCDWVRGGLNDGQWTDTFVVEVVINRIGPFGYDTVFSPIGKTLNVTFEVGLPVGQYSSYYMPSVQYQLVIQRV